MKVAVERVGSRIYLRSPWSPEMPERCKSLGGSWAKTARAWTYPLDLEMCRRLRDEFGQELQIGPELNKWAWEQRALERRLHQATDVQSIDIMRLVDLPRVRELAPTMWGAMLDRPYQPVASYYMATAGQALNGDHPGLGKTIESIGALVESKAAGQVLVLCPKTSARVVWEPEIHKWLSDYKNGYTVTVASGQGGRRLDNTLAIHTEATQANPDGLHFLVCNAEMARIKKYTICPAGICDGDEDWCPGKADHINKSEVRIPYLFSIQWEAIIADETHKWLINTRGKSASQVGYGFTKLQTSDADRRYALTGTPLKGKKHNLFGTINWLRPKVYTSKWKWIETYFEVGDDGYGRTIGDMRKSRQEAFFRSLNSIMIRRTKAELRALNPDWMPPDKIYHDVYVDLDPKQLKLYKAMEKSAEVELDGGRLDAIGVLAEFTRLKQFAGCGGDMVDGRFTPKLPSAKLDWLLQFLEERGIDQQGLSDDVRKVVVASQFTQFINLWAAELQSKGITSYVLTGETRDAVREQIVKRFQSKDDVRVFFINTTAGGVSITLDAADDIVLMDETWVPDEQGQVEDRVHRVSNVKHQVDVWYVRARGTIEDKIAKVNVTKAESNHVTLDAQRGLEFAYKRYGQEGKQS